MEFLGIPLDEVEMSEEVSEYLREIGGITWADVSEAIRSEMESRCNEDYTVNPIQFAKMVNAYHFFEEVAKAHGGRVDPIKIEPKEKHVGITAYCLLFDFYGDYMTRFADIMSDCLSLSIDALTDGTVCFSFLIPDVFVRK